MIKTNKKAWRKFCKVTSLKIQFFQIIWWTRRNRLHNSFSYHNNGCNDDQSRKFIKVTIWEQNTLSLLKRSSKENFYKFTPNRLSSHWLSRHPEIKIKITTKRGERCIACVCERERECVCVCKCVNWEGVSVKRRVK